MAAEAKHYYKNTQANSLPKICTSFIRTKAWNICISFFERWKRKLLLLNETGHGNNRIGQN